MKMSIVYWSQCKKKQDFSIKCTEVYWHICLVNQWIMLGKLVVKNQIVRRTKQNNIEVQIHITTSRENYKQDSNFRDSTIWWTIK